MSFPCSFWFSRIGKIILTILKNTILCSILIKHDKSNIKLNDQEREFANGGTQLSNKSYC